MANSPNPMANKQVLDLLADLGRPVDLDKITNLLRLNRETVRTRSKRLHAAGRVARSLSDDGKRQLWGLKGAKKAKGKGFTRHNPVSALPPLERVVCSWLRKAPFQGGLNGQ